MSVKPSEELAQAVAAIRAVFEAVVREQSPFENTGSTFSCDVFQVEAYSWVRDDQTWNFRWRDLEVSWYKYHPRSMSANRLVTATEVSEMLRECTAAIYDAVQVKQ